MDIIFPSSADNPNPDLTGELDRSSDPSEPVLHLEAGCNELWLTQGEATALRDYLTRMIPQMRSAESEPAALTGEDS